MQFLNSTALIEYLFSSKGNQILYTCTHVLYNLIFFVWTKTIQISQSSFRKIPQVFFFKIKRKVLTISLKPSWSKWLNQNIRNFFFLVISEFNRSKSQILLLILKLNQGFIGTNTLWTEIFIEITFTHLWHMEYKKNMEGMYRWNNIIALIM